MIKAQNVKYSLKVTDDKMDELEKQLADERSVGFDFYDIIHISLA